MFRSQAIRTVTKTNRVAIRRRYATQAPPPDPVPGLQPPKTNTALYATVGAALAAGVYYYYGVYEHPEKVDQLKRDVKSDGDDVARKARELGDASKAKAESTYYDGKAKAESTYNDAKATASGKISDAEAKARGLYGEARAKYDEEVAAAKRSLSSARDSTENLYNDARASAERKYGEVVGGSQKKADEAKAGWFSWLGWGKSKAEGAKENAAGKVAEGAEDVRKRADKHS